MSLEVTRHDSIETTNRNQWNNVVEQSDLGCVYHRYEWLRAVEAGTDHEPRHLVVSKKGNPIAVFPNFVVDLGPVRRLTSMRPGYGGPVATSNEEAALEMLLEAIPELASGTILFNELRTYDRRYVRYHDALREHGYRLAIKECRFTLDLTRGWDALYDDMDGERRRGIRRGHENEIAIVDEEVTEETLSTFYEGYATVLERVGTEPEPRSFMLELTELVDRVKLFTLEVEGTPRGAFLHILDDEQSAVQHLFTAVKEEHFEYHAAELLHEHAIKWGIDNGYETYELRGAVPDFRDGLYQFKSFFGAQPTALLVWERGCPSPALPLLHAGRSIERRFRAYTGEV